MFVHRPILMSEAGAVVSGHHKASEAGAAVLRAGGNAMDAAVAASAVLCVAIPHMNGLGGDCIALHYEARSGRVTAINGSGRAPQAATIDAIRAAGHAAMPARGPLSIPVCGLVDAWQAALETFGTRPLEGLLAPAAALARDGVPTDLVQGAFFAGPVYAQLAAEFPALAALYGPPGPRPLGARIRNPALAATIETIARDGAAALYRGELGRALIADLRAAGALLSEADLAAHRTRFEPSLSVGFDGRRVHAAPPNSQGIALAVLAGLAELERERHGRVAPLEPATYLAAKRIAFACRAEAVGDPESVPRPDPLIEPDALRRLAEAQAAAAPAAEAAPALRPAGDTSTLVVVDRWGNAVSWVQSLFEEFGSGVVSPATGLVMHNRLALQGLDAAGRWPLQPGRRPFHTLCPAIVVHEGRCELAIATPGDHGQPQTLFQVLLQLRAEGANLQAAIEAPRLRHDSGRRVMVESRVPEAWRAEILSAGYEVQDVGPWSRLTGGVNAILANGEGLLMAGADPRRASYAVTAD